ncbi:MAG TPA: DUF4404 family protein [Burkholderiaceae bacterium]|jgi:hypothetical protein|nr:DUF4404 family protein [Burkholderiaceae bacterium]
MEINDLKVTLNKLHKELESTGNVDEELKQLLQVLDRDIDLLLKKDEHDPLDAVGLAERSQAISAKFAVEHPRIEPLLRQLGAILERIGI